VSPWHDVGRDAVDRTLDMSPAHARFTVASLTVLVVLGTAFAAVLVLTHHHIGTALTIGAAWSIGAQGLAWGLMELLTPATVVRWRWRLMANSAGVPKAVGDAFDKRLALQGPEPWKDPKGLTRTRRLGILLLILWAGLITGSVLLLQPLDALFTRSFTR